MTDEQKVFIPPKRVNTDYPVSRRTTRPEDRANRVTPTGHRHRSVRLVPRRVRACHELSLTIDLAAVTGDEHTDMHEPTIGCTALEWRP